MIAFRQLKKYFREIIQSKEKGNELFNAGKLEEALVQYQAALDKFGLKLGANGEQRICYIALLSNMSLIHYKEGAYILSEENGDTRSALTEEQLRGSR